MRVHITNTLSVGTNQHADHDTDEEIQLLLALLENF